MKLTDEEITKFKKLENKDFTLGRITKYLYNDKGKIARESIFENDSIIKLIWDFRYYYNENDSLTKMTEYTAIPDIENEQLNETQYFYKDNTLYMSIEKKEDKAKTKIDSTYYNVQTDSLNVILSKTKLTFSNRKKLKISNCETELYEYDINGNKIRETEVSMFKLAAIRTYEYNEKKQLIRLYNKNISFHVNEIINYTYDSAGNIKDEITNDLSNSKKVKKITYSYNDNNQVKEEIHYINNQVDYSYITEFNTKGKKTKYIQISPDGISSIWLYFYGKNDSLEYKVDLYSREEE